MKKLLVATIAVIGLVGCTVEDTGSSNSSNNNTYTPTPAPSQGSSVSDEDLYVLVIRSEYRELNSMSDYELIDFGKNMCTAIDDGLTVPGLALLSIEYGVDAEMLGFITGAATSAFCPRHNDFFDGY